MFTRRDLETQWNPQIRRKSVKEKMTYHLRKRISTLFLFQKKSKVHIEQTYNTFSSYHNPLST